MTISNPWKTAHRAAIAACWAVLLFFVALALTGCMCADGLRRMPCAALQTDRAIARAEAAGACAAYTQSGQVRYLRGSEAKQYRALRSRAATAGEPSPVVEGYAGSTAEELRAEQYPLWLRGVAWLGDALTLAGASWGAAKAADAINDASGSGGDSSSDSSERTVNVKADNGARVNVQLGQYNDGGQSAGDAAPAEEAEAE